MLVFHFANIFLLKRDTDVQVVSLCSSRQDASFDMQHDLLWSPRKLDLRSNFDLDLLRSKRICFDASQRRKHDGVIADSLSFLVQKEFVKNDIRQKRLV